MNEVKNEMKWMNEKIKWLEYGDGKAKNAGDMKLEKRDKTEEKPNNPDITQYDCSTFETETRTRKPCKYSRAV